MAPLHHFSKLTYPPILRDNESDDNFNTTLRIKHVDDKSTKFHILEDHIEDNMIALFAKTTITNIDYNCDIIYAINTLKFVSWKYNY